MMIDTHCHLSSEYFDNISEIIGHMGNNLMVFGGVDNEYNKEIISTIKLYPNVFGTLGLHPDVADSYTDDDINYIETNINNNKIVGIGEIGLDYHGDIYNKEKQKELFIKQLKLANKYDKTVLVHSRDAIEDTFEIMSLYPNLKYILHCYGSSLEMAKKFIKCFDIKFGIGGVVTFKNGRRLQEVVENIDLKYLVLETDCPFMSPDPIRGTKNEPYNIIYVAKKIAEIKKISLDDVLNVTTNNAKYIYNLDK